MRPWLAVMVVVVCWTPVRVATQTNPLWSEQKVKNFLPHMMWPEVRDLLSRTDMVLIPLPALEQHGFHGPIGTDYYTGVERSKLIAQRTDLLVAPILLVGQSPYHLAFPGSIALSAETLQRVYFEAAQSLIEQGFRRVLLYASHAGNQYIASYVADRLNQETPAVAVNLADGVEAMRDPEDGLRSTAEMSTTGAWSERDPREATAEEGRRATEAFVDAAVRFIERWKQLRPSPRPPV